MSHPLSPPIFRGKIPTTSGRLLLAAAVMFALDLPLYALIRERSEPAFFLEINFVQVVLLVIVLLLSPRRWVALLLMLPACFFFMPLTPATVAWERLLDCACAIVPLLLGIFTAYPSPRKRWVYVEEEKGADAAKGEGADTPSH